MSRRRSPSALARAVAPAFAAFLLFSNRADAQALSGPPPPSSGLPEPSHPRSRVPLVLNGVHVRPTVSALRQHADALRAEDPALYARLDPLVSELETRRTLGWTVFASSLAVGAGLITAGALVGASSDDDPLGAILLVSGVVVAGGGTTLGLSLLPDAHDVRAAAASAEGPPPKPREEARLPVTVVPTRTSMFAALSLRL